MKKRLFKILSMVICMILLSSALVIASFGAEGDTTVTLADSTTTWRYLWDNTDPAKGYDSHIAWTLSDFDDSGWGSSSGKFGSKNGSLSAINGCTPTVLMPLKTGDATSNNMAYFFRTKINVEDIGNISAISFNVNADDAVVLYVNGRVAIDTRLTKNDTTSLHYSWASSLSVTFWLNNEELRELFVEGENTIAASVHNANSTSSDVYFDLTLNALYSENYVTTFDNVVMGVGKDETERTFNWYTTSSEVGEVQWTLASDMSAGKFPEVYFSVSAEQSRSSSLLGQYINKATITGLEKNTEYVYRLKNGNRYSQLYYFTTGGTENFDFVVFGDPQLRKWAFNTTPGDLNCWNQTMATVKGEFDPELYISLGDQINTQEVVAQETEYEAFIGDNFTSIPISTVVGNHDRYMPLYSEHFNVANKSEVYGVDEHSANSWFTYGDVLFINLKIIGEMI